MAELLLIHIPGHIEPIDRGERFEDPLEKALRAGGRLGTCVGGGTAFQTEPEFRVTGCDIELDVKDLARATPIIRDTLRSANAPAGTTVTDANANKVLLRFTKSGVREFTAAKKRAPKRFVDSCPWECGEVLAYRLTRDRYVLLHVYGFGGLGPIFWVPEWCGSAIPANDEIRRLVRRTPEFYRLGSVFEAWRTTERDRDERRVVRTGVVIAPPKNGLRGWCPGVVQMCPWKKFERLLREVFGIVSVSPAVRLSHDLGLLTETAHLAVWAPDGRVTKGDAKRLFYAHASGFRRTHPDRVRPAVTDGLRQLVADLKAEFAGVDPWAGDFAAREAFVIIPVKRRSLDKIWTAATRLARRHRLACYDPESDRFMTFY